MCEYCNDIGEIETDNNGPIGPCPMCRPADPAGSIPELPECTRSACHEVGQHAHKHTGELYCTRCAREINESWDEPLVPFNTGN